MPCSKPISLSPWTARAAAAARVASAAAVIVLLSAAVAPEPYGRWGNPRGTLAVQIAPCGEHLCGTIVWASPVAVADAREAGVNKLDGIELLQDYRPAGAGVWAGRVYVPDMGRTFSSRIVAQGADALAISGCLIGRFFCKSQVWHRLS